MSPRLEFDITADAITDTLAINYGYIPNGNQLNILVTETQRYQDKCYRTGYVPEFTHVIEFVCEYHMEQVEQEDKMKKVMDELNKKLNKFRDGNSNGARFLKDF